MHVMIKCHSGVQVLVKARSIEQANKNWDALAEAGEAEPRIPGQSWRPSRSEVQHAIDCGRDYR